jgi:carbon dioxide concentrating mechanism protein CcmN
VVGQSKIGKNACIGSSSTILNTSIAPGTAIEAGSLIGDKSRLVSSEISEPSKAIKSETNGSVPETNGSIPKPETKEAEKPEFVEEMEDLWLEPETKVEEIPEIPTQPNTHPEPVNAPVVGQIYINQLLCTLFPERQAFNRSQNNPSS